MWFFWKNNRNYFIILALFTLLSSAIVMAYPLVFKYIIDSLIMRMEIKENNYFIKIILILIPIGILRSIANFYPAIRAKLNLKFEMDLREYYFGEILKKGFNFFQRFRTGDIVTRLTEDISEFPKLSWILCSAIFRAVESAGKFLTCIILMAIINWKLSLVSITPLPVMLIIFSKLRHKLSLYWESFREEVSKTESQIETSLSGIRIIKAFRAEKIESNNFEARLNERIKIEERLIRLMTLLESIYEDIGVVGQSLVILYGGFLVIKPSPELTLGEFYAFYIYMSMLLWPLLDIPNLFVLGKQSFTLIDREEEMYHFEKENHVRNEGETLDNIESVELKNVCFSYDGNDTFKLKDINLKIRKGESVAIVGKIGSGKSTIVRIASGILKPQSGEILINKKRLSKIDMKGFWAKTAVVEQEPHLFSETIAENITFGRLIKDGDIERAIEISALSDDIRIFPDGLLTKVDLKGGSLSGGQKQRLSLARAIVNNPSLLLMDDITSNLDAKCERRVIEELSHLMSNRITLIVTKNNKILSGATRVILIDNGKIIDEGRDEELAARSSLYRRLVGIK